MIKACLYIQEIYNKTVELSKRLEHYVEQVQLAEGKFTFVYRWEQEIDENYHRYRLVDIML